MLFKNFRADEYKLHRLTIIKNAHKVYQEAFAKFNSSQIDALRREYAVFQLRISNQVTSDENKKFADLCKIPPSTFFKCLTYLEGQAKIDSVNEMVANLIEAIST